MGDVIEILTTATNTVKVEAQGPQGIPGVGVPTGGSTGQVLRKASSADYATEWAAAGSGSGSVTSVALASTDLTISGSPITDSGTITANIAANAVTLEKLQTISSEHLLGRHGSGNGGVQQIGLGTGLAISGSNVGVTFGSSAGTACAGNDARLSDARTPSSTLAHASSHASSGSDPLAPSDIGAAALNHTHIFATDIATALAEDPDLCRQYLGLGDMATEPSGNFSTAGHGHGNLTSDGKLGSTAGLPVVTTTAGEVTTLALGTANQVLKVNSGGTAVEFGEAGGVVSGSVDNAILRANGTGGSTSQSSDLVIDDYTASTQGNITVSPRLLSFSCTVTASDDFVTATGHTFSNGDQVVFTSLTGGSGLNTNARYFVVSAETNKFKVSTSSGGSVVNITTDATAGTVQLITAVVVNPNNIGAFILGQKPDGVSTAGGNARGVGAIDLQLHGNVARSGAAQVASGTYSTIVGGFRNTANGYASGIFSSTTSSATNESAIIVGGGSNTASGKTTCVINSGLSSATAEGAMVISGLNCEASAAYALAIGRYAIANRRGMVAFSHTIFSAFGDGQRIFSILSNKTSISTPVELFIDGTAATSRLTVPSGKIMACIINICASTSGGEFSNHYVRRVMIGNRSGTTALRGGVTNISTEEGISGADVTISADDTNDAIRIDFSGVAPVTGCTGTASTDRINKVAHGFSNNDDIIFSSLTGGAGLTANTVTYWVINANADDFQVSTTRGGAAVNITTDYTDMTAARLFRVVASVDAVEVGFGT